MAAAPSNPISTRCRAEHLGPERRRPRALDTALEIAAEQGVANVTMAAVAERMAVTRPVVYACYSGRGELLTALLDREREWAITTMLAMLPPRRTGSVEQMFVDGFCALLSTVRELPASWRIIVAADPDPVLTEAIARGRTQIAARVATVMRPLLERRQVADLDRSLPVLAEIFVTICESAARMMLDDERQWTPESLAEIVGRAAYRALRATA